MHTLKFDWNPLTGIDLFGNFKLHFYSLMWVVGFIAGWYILKRIFTREKVNIEFLDPLFIYTVLGTMLGARLGHVLFYQSELIQEDFFSIFLPFSFKNGVQFTGFQGLASHGALIGIIIGMYLYRRKYKYKSLIWIFDHLTIPFSFGIGFIRIGNFINSEINGKITDSVFGVRFIQDYYSKYQIVKETGIKNVKEAYDSVLTNPELLEAVPYRHPAQLYEAFCYFIMFCIIWTVYTKTNKGNKPGFLFGLFLVLLWTVRFAIEVFKEPQVAGREDYVFFMNTGQLLSVPFILLGLYLIFRKTQTPSNK